MRRQVKLVVGLGNPGTQYETTRHNAGFIALDLLADDLGIEVGQEKHQALMGSGLVAGNKVLLAKPLTYMNRSGEAVGRIARWYNLAPEDIIIIHDDLDLPPGRLRLRGRGGSGGHRGVSSIIEALGTEKIVRVKIGIGRPPAGIDPVDYVLQPFSVTDWEQIRPILLKAAAAARFILEGHSLEEAMNIFNC
ncbi:MAG: peptidyl-tRNA hydrolase, family [Clostridia bacterium]|nr:peptidyl-tRNA hydrolase, family [Clostridia bacterium]